MSLVPSDPPKRAVGVHADADVVGQRAATVGAACTVGVAAIVLVGWVTGNDALKGFGRAQSAMSPVTAYALIAAALGLVCLQRRDAGPLRKLAGRLAAGVAVIVGATRLFAYGTGTVSVVDALAALGNLSIEPHSPVILRTALDLLLVGLALWSLDWQTRRGRRPAEGLSALAALIAFLALLGYAYGIVVYYRTATYVPMSLPGAVAFFTLSGGILLARPDRGMLAILYSNTEAGLLMRLLLPLALLVPLLLGAVRRAGESAGWYDSKLGVTLFATVFIVFFLLSIWWTARLLFRRELEHRSAEDRIRHLNAELEQRVAERTLELLRVNAELVRASQAKDQFLAVLSHELRTPLTPALATISYLAEHQDLPDDLRDDLRAVRGNIQLEARLIDDLLDLTRITRGGVELRRENVDAHRLARCALEIAHDAIRRKQLDVVTEFRAAAHHVSADPVRLQQVCWNLVNNAVKFTEPGGRIVVRTANENGQLLLEIADTGAGIEPEQQRRIFDAFEQGERSSSRQFGGLGLGLAIAKTLVTLHGGTITVESAGRGRGATFRVSLATVAEPAATAFHAPDQSRGAAEKLALLLVEDHEQTARTLAGFLRKRGHEVKVAETVQAALHFLEARAFDALISDIGLPDGTGCDVMRAAKFRGAPRGIALSGFGMAEDIQRSLDAGFDQHLTKPIDFQVLEHYLATVPAAAAGGSVPARPRPGVFD